MYLGSRLRTIAIGGLLAMAATGAVGAPAKADTTGPDPSVAVGLDHDVYRLGDPITGTMTVTNVGDTATDPGVVVHVFPSTMHVVSIDFGAFSKTNTTSAVLNRPMEPGETLKVVVHASATGFLLAPGSTSMSGRVDYTGDVSKANNWDDAHATYNTSGQTAVVSGTVFADANRDGLRQSGEAGGELAGPSLWWAPGQGQGVGIHTDGSYSFTGIIGQDYELHFDVYEPATYVGTSDRVHTFTLGSGGRTFDYGVAVKNAPTPAAASPSPSAVASAPAPRSTSAPRSSVAPGSGDATGGDAPVVPVAASAGAGALASPPAAAASDADTPEATDAATAATATPASQGGSSSWLWIVVALLLLVGVGTVVGRRFRRGPIED